jgi:phenylalanyl-tRNA synthetase alpha chain
MQDNISIKEAKEAFERTVRDKNINDVSALNGFKHEWLSKNGVLKQLYKVLASLKEPEEKKQFAMQCNSLKESVERYLSEQEEKLEKKNRHIQLQTRTVDFSLPSRGSALGRMNQISVTEKKILDVLKQCGFQSVQGPLIETEYYCFDTLNIQKDHPARDMQDTFFLDLDPAKNSQASVPIGGEYSRYVLRTHTTSIQSRFLEKRKLPLKILAFGQSLRNEAEDAGHTATFHQFELIWVEKGLTLANLMGLISFIIKELFGKRRKIRFVPKYYPYTEPSIGVQIDDSNFNENYDESSGWVTVGGAGMIHKKVFEAFAIDSSEFSGCAFGLGTSRMAAQSLNLSDIRKVYANDLRIYL